MKQEEKTRIDKRVVGASACPMPHCAVGCRVQAEAQVQVQGMARHELQWKGKEWNGMRQETGKLEDVEWNVSGSTGVFEAASLLYGTLLYSHRTRLDAARLPPLVSPLHYEYILYVHSHSILVCSAVQYLSYENSTTNF